jgi:hypothetical protein
MAKAPDSANADVDRPSLHFMRTSRWHQPVRLKKLRLCPIFFKSRLEQYVNAQNLNCQFAARRPFVASRRNELSNRLQSHRGRRREVYSRPN